MTEPTSIVRRRGGKRRTTLGLVLSATFVLATLRVLPFPAITVEWPTVSGEDSTGYTPSFTAPLDHEIVLVYFGSATCGWSNHPDLPGVIDSAKVMVRGHALALGASFSAVGIAIDWDTKDGVNHLDEVGHFDYIATGRKMHGLEGQAYLDFLEGTPQVSVLERTVQHPQGEVPARFDERELMRHTSLGRIANWVRSGASIPTEIE